MSSTAEGIAGPRIAAKSEPISRRLARTFSRGPLNAFLIMIGLFWLIPSLGLLISSFRAPADYTRSQVGGRC